MCRYLVVSGGVISGVGKGIGAASIGLLLKMRGERVQLIKFDPYLNHSASLLSPFQHGEVYLCEDGSETDLDLGHYERLTGIEMSHRNICTSGKLQDELHDEEIKGKYLGQTIQTMPHVTDKVLERLTELGKDVDIVIVEIGGTVGDVESWIFFEAVRQLRRRLGEQAVMLCHVAPMLWLNTTQEWKTKPLQNSVRDLRSQGLHPDMILCRNLADRPISEKLFDKISLMTGVSRDAVFEAPEAASIYQVPLHFYDRHVDDFVADRFHLRRNGVRIHRWRDLVEKLMDISLPHVSVGVVGKYAKAQDAYLSLKEAICHAAVANDCHADIKWIESEDVEAGKASLEGLNCVIVPGGFDVRGIEGKIKAVSHCRLKKVPFLGICLGLQCAVIEFCRNVCEIKDATSEEFGNGSHVIHEVPIDRPGGRMAGTLRLGSFECALQKGSVAAEAYKRRLVRERHRHRFEVNRDFLDRMAQGGLAASGINPDTGLVEVMELDRERHPFFIGCQGHPEFKSRLGQPHPLFEKLLAHAKAATVSVNIEPRQGD